MREYSLYCYLFYSLVLCLPFPVVEADGNVFLRGIRTETQSAYEKADVQQLNCPGVRSLGDLPIITGGTTSISQQSLASKSFTSNDGSMSFSQEVLFKCSEDPSLLTSPGIWYSVKGIDAFIHATLLFENDAVQKMAVFEATDGGCQPSQCLMVSNSMNEDLDWFAASDTTYFIKVFGASSSQAGSFVLRMEDFSPPRPHNDRCHSSETLQMGVVTRDASFEAWPHGLANAQCALDAHSRGLFYTFEGTGQVITVTLRPSISEGKLGLVILSGDDCGICVGHSRFVTAIDSKQVVTMPTQTGEMYHILVSGEDIGDAGSFQLSVS